jgi:hypothetical protein
MPHPNLPLRNARELGGPKAGNGNCRKKVREDGVKWITCLIEPLS